MRKIAVFAILVVLASFHTADAGCYSKKTRRPSKDELLYGPKYTGANAKAVEPHAISDLPKNFSWCNVNGKSYCGPSWNQHIPVYCGACWVHGTLHAVNDRIKILKGGFSGTGDTQLARQVILNCGQHHGLGNGCNGGDTYDVYEFMYRYGLPDESCQNYAAKESEKCDDQAMCANCMPVGPEGHEVKKCWAIKNYTNYRVFGYGRIAPSEAAIMSEIYARGPVTCGMASTDEMDYDYFGGVFVDKTGSTDMNHDIEVVGWGETDEGVKYWLLRNSWGTYWGEGGFIKVIRGVNNMLLESECTFALPDISDEKLLKKGYVVGGMYGLRDKPKKAQKEDHDPARFGSDSEDYPDDADDSSDSGNGGDNNDQQEDTEKKDKKEKHKKKDEQPPQQAEVVQSAQSAASNSAVTTTPHEGEGSALSLGATVLAIAAVVGLSALLVKAFKHSQASSYDSIS